MDNPTDEKKTKRTGKQANGRNTPNDIVTLRRERVMALRARFLSLQEIYNTLSMKELPPARPGEKPRPNPSFFPNADGEGFDISTLYRDIQWCNRDALKRAQRETDKHRAEQLEILREAIRVAWSKGKLDIVIRTVETMAKLTGTIITKVENKMDPEQFNRLVEEMSDAELARLAAGDI